MEKREARPRVLSVFSLGEDATKVSSDGLQEPSSQGSADTPLKGVGILAGCGSIGRAGHCTKWFL